LEEAKRGGREVEKGTHQELPAKRIKKGSGRNREEEKVGTAKKGG
jgi:hypothetical protein